MMKSRRIRKIKGKESVLFRASVFALLIVFSLALFSCEYRTEESEQTYIEETIEGLEIGSTLASSGSIAEPPARRPIVYDGVVPVYSEDGIYPSVLMYHLIMDEPYAYYDLFVKEKNFEDQLNFLYEEGYAFLFANDFNKVEGPSIMITFDDGYADNYSTVFPLLKKYKARATIFVITCLLDTPGYLTKEQVKEMSDSGYVYIGSHTVDHAELAEFDDDFIIFELSESKRQIEELTGKPCEAIAYPCGSYNDHVLELVSEYFDYGYSTKSPYQISNYTNLNIPRYGISRLTELDEYTGICRSHLYNSIKKYTVQK